MAAHERKAYAVDQADVPLPALQALIGATLMQAFIHERDLDTFGKSLGLKSSIGNELLPYAHRDRMRFIVSIPYSVERGRVAEDQHRRLCCAADGWRTGLS